MPKKLTIEDMSRMADAHGGRCLSENYVNSQTKLKWQCREGHNWRARPNHIQRGHWCPACAKVGLRLTMDDMFELASSKEGKCLSKKYVNSASKLKWECKEGHRWRATPASIKRGVWCPACSGRKRLDIKEMRKIAKSRGGKCVSTKYVNTLTKLTWECVKGHQWDASPHNVRQGTWCPTCYGKNPTIERMQEMAESKGGKCLSEEFVSKKKLIWECEHGHTWSALPGSIKQGSWCPTCNGGIKLTLDVMHEAAAKKGGKCLSTEYLNSRTKLNWECKEGHQWNATPSSINQGSWCPVCARRRGK